jgi:type II secretory ATPase GspE/PulE/Tfp pilus assembly ATPase PilB-like protein
MDEQITGQVIISPAEAAKTTKRITNVVNFKSEIEKNLNLRTTDFLKVILGGAISMDASDIHAEPKKTVAKIRVRVDGLLQDTAEMELIKYNALLSRIKLLSGIKLNISGKPQDGRFSIAFGEQANIEIRTSSLPTEYGESLVLRILNPKSLIEIEKLGLRKDLFETLQEEIQKPNGMIIMTGPTGSGKTTTLYAILKKIHNPNIKIITIEDPIEYHIKGISQTQTNETKGYNFANGLRAIVRQDPDVILVGEIRDQETVQIAIQAALTGHLVLSTVHTNDAVGTIARLIALGAHLPNIGPALNIAAAQRLVRKVCPKCSKLETPTDEEMEKIKEGLKSLPKSINLPKKIDANLKIAKIKGCKSCNSTGYKGRVAIFEIIKIDGEMEKFISKEPSTVEIKEKALSRGFVTMEQDGLLKILQGVTTFGELERTT